MRPTIRLFVTALFLSLTTAAVASAEPAPRAERTDARDGKAKGKNQGKRFAKMDKNSDGFLTEAEVGERRWNKIKVADANKDSKVSKVELQKAKADGKLRHKGKGKGNGKHKGKAKGNDKARA